MNVISERAEFQLGFDKEGKGHFRKRTVKGFLEPETARNRERLECNAEHGSSPCVQPYLTTCQILFLHLFQIFFGTTPVSFSVFRGSKENINV